jgi:hypothetical protein
MSNSTGHTATLYQGDKLLIYGGENEHRNYLSDVIIFDVKTAHWTQPAVHGPVPRGRARHAAVLHEDRLFIVGGLTGNSNHVLDDICFLDLKTWTWSRTWKFVGRFDHTAWIWGNRMWVFGGLGEDMERGGELFWLDLKDSPAFSTSATTARNSSVGGRSSSHRSGHSQPPPQLLTGSTGYAANSSSVQAHPASIGPISLPVAPGSISSLKFISGGNLPPQASGTHFHIYSSGNLLDFVTPAATIRNTDCSLSALELESLSWQKLAEGPEIFTEGYRWHYCAMNEDRTKAWLLGCASSTHNEEAGEWEDYLSDVLALDLRKFGLLGNSLAPEPRESRIPASDRHPTSSLSALGTDLAGMFDQQGSDSTSDFVVTANGDLPTSPSEDDDQDPRDTTNRGSWISQISPPIHVHKLILQSRWPHFCRLWNSQMAEFHTRKMHIPEPDTVVRAFLYYLYTDSIARHHENCPNLSDVAGMLVMANLYDMPRLRLLCLNRLGKELDVDNAATIWERATTAQEAWLRRRAARFIQTHWGYVSRTPGFKTLSRSRLLELCMSTDPDGRLVGGEEWEVVGGLGGSRLGVGGIGLEGQSRSGSSTTVTGDADESERSEDDDMEIT